MCFFVWSANASSQSMPGEISGTVTDEKGEPLPGASVTYDKNGTLQGAVTDVDGRYRLKPLDAGKYDITYSYVGFKKEIHREVSVSSGQITSLSVKLLIDDGIGVGVEVFGYRNLFEPDQTMRADVLDAQQIEMSLARNPKEFVALTSQANARDEGRDINIRGSRSDATQYYVDGIKMIGGFSIPKACIKEIKVISGGVPAMFGDATGGIVLITTKSYWDN